MPSLIPILAHTHDSFVNAVFAALGQGKEHASLLYREFFRTGQIKGEHPSFKNAQRLLQDILALLELTRPTQVKDVSDGSTHKFLLKTHDGFEIESVFIPMQAGQTLCVSSQVGCRLGCSFCETGRMGLLRNLTTQEIVSQIFTAKFEKEMTIRNVVFMGMGEPLDNYDAVVNAIRVLSEPFGFAFGRKHITLSTSGRVDGIKRLLAEPTFPANLAVSINAPNDALRRKLMPVNNQYPLSVLYQAMHSYCQQNRRQILVAYVLMKGINDDLILADELAHYLKGLNVKINLIPYNAQSCDRYLPPENSHLLAFKKRLQSFGYRTLLRLTKGNDIMAACGQLGNLELRKLKLQLHRN